LEARLSTGQAPHGESSAPQLAFAIEDGGVLEYAAVPTLRFGLRIESSGGAPIRSLSLNVQLRIAAPRRPYEQHDRERLVELFGPTGDFGRNLRGLHWTNLALHVGPFSGSTVVEMPVTCTYDLDVTASRYFHALEDGEVPLEFLFGGLVFYAGPEGRLQVQPIAWNQEAEFRLPVSVWREMMDHHFPGQAWLRLDRTAFDRLHAYKRRNTLLTWEDTVDSLVRAAGEDET
jgi:Family of unknown function (DUF6084)